MVDFCSFLIQISHDIQMFEFKLDCLMYIHVEGAAKRQTKNEKESQLKNTQTPNDTTQDEQTTRADN